MRSVVSFGNETQSEKTFYNLFMVVSVSNECLERKPKSVIDFRNMDVVQLIKSASDLQEDRYISFTYSQSIAEGSVKSFQENLQ